MSTLVAMIALPHNCLDGIRLDGFDGVGLNQVDSLGLNQTDRGWVAHELCATVHKLCYSAMPCELAVPPVPHPRT